MLRTLEVENLLLIERAELAFGPGLNALTGETGAGKTLLATAIGLLLGDRSRSGLVRPGSDMASVNGVFDLPATLPAGLDRLVPEGATELVLGRTVWPDGRSRARICGRAATVADLRSVASGLITFHGQHEHRKLTLSEFQLDVLDAACGRGQAELLGECAAAHADVLSAEGRLASLGGGGGGAEREADLLRWELDEIDSVAPDPAEREALLGERVLLREVDAIGEALEATVEALRPEEGDRGAVAAIEEAARVVDGLGEAAGAVGDLGARLRALAIEADDIAREARSRLEVVEASPGRLAELEERLEQYHSLERKHGGTVEAVLAHAERCRARLGELDDLEGAMERLELELGEALVRRERAADALSAARREAASGLAARVVEELAELGLEGAGFSVEIRPRDVAGAAGIDRVEFMVSPNPGIPEAPLADSASGGEVSRVLLALLAVANARAGESGRVLVFDEIDAGIGGRTAVSVAGRLARISEGAQVLCITHLAPVAARASTHFRIDKRSAGEQTVTTVDRLEGDTLVEELMRMLGASEGDDVARAHAERLLAGGSGEAAD